MKFEFVRGNRSRFDAAEMCEVLGVSTSGYYRWEGSEPSLRQSEDETFKEKILEIRTRRLGTTATARSTDICLTTGSAADGTERFD